MGLIFLSAVAIGFSGAMMPGSLLTYTIRQSLANGPKAGFIIIFGHAVLELALLVLIFLGFDIILQSIEAQIAIGVIGGLFLMHMGVNMIASSIKNKLFISMGSDGADEKSMFLSGMAISVANPYFLLWWAVIGLGFVMQAYQSFGYLGAAMFFTGHIIADFVWYGLVSTVVGTTRKFIKERPYRMVILLLGCMLVFFGFSFIYGAISSLTA